MIIFEERWNKLEYLGEGIYGKVYLVYDKVLDKNIALKLFDINIFNKYPSSILQELNVGFNINNKHLINYLFTKVVKYDHQYFFSVGIELCLGDLINYYSVRSINSDEIIKIIYEILIGLVNLNNNNYCHNDLTLGNVLVHEDGVKISDFGNTQHLYFDHLEHKIPQEYKPPILEKKAKEKNDIWSLGVIIYWLIFKKGITKKESQKKFFEYNLDYFPDWISSKIQEIIKDIFIFNPNDRLNATGLLKKHFNVDINVIEKEEKIIKIPTKHLKRINELADMFRKEIIINNSVIWNCILLLQSNGSKIECIDYYYWISLTMLNKQKTTISSIKNKSWLIREVENLNKVLEKVNYKLINLNHDIDGLEEEYNNFYLKQLNIDFSYKVIKGLDSIMKDKCAITDINDYTLHIYDIYHYAKYKEIDITLEELIEKFD